MAIAYFIPDQTKLLAGQRNATSTNNNRNRSSNQAATTTAPRESTTTSRGSGTNPINTNTNRGYGTTINISVPTFNAAPQETLGCWDFLTQVFCYALRFYHESSQLQPTVIQISVNFNAQTNATEETTVPTTTTTTANDSTNESLSANESSNNLATAATNTPNANHKPQKFSKRKN